MPLTTVTTVTATGQKWPLCSCGWEGTRTTVPRDAWREKAHHERECPQRVPAPTPPKENQS